MLTQDRLKELLHYDPETGAWTWLVSRGGPTRAGAAAGGPRRHKTAFYWHISVDGRSYPSHRLVFLYMTGWFPPDGLEPDHIDRNSLNNVWSNLRLVTRSQNQANTRVYKSNKLGVKGVHRSGSYYRAFISESGKNRSLGYFFRLEDASAAYQRAASRLYGQVG